MSECLSSKLIGKDTEVGRCHLEHFEFVIFKLVYLLFLSWRIELCFSLKLEVTKLKQAYQFYIKSITKKGITNFIINSSLLAHPVTKCKITKYIFIFFNSLYLLFGISLPNYLLCSFFCETMFLLFFFLNKPIIKCLKNKTNCRFLR